MSLINDMSGWEDTSFHQCRWGFCRLSFLTLDSLERHVEDHLKRSEPVDKDAFGVTFRDGWYRGEEKKSTGLDSLIEKLGHHKKPRLSEFTEKTSSNHVGSSTSGSAPAAIIVTSTSSFLHPSSRSHPASSPPSQNRSQPRLQLKPQSQRSDASSDTSISSSQLRSQSRRSLPYKPGGSDLIKTSQDVPSSFVPSREPQAHVGVGRLSTSGLVSESGTQQLSAKVRHTTPPTKSQISSADGLSLSSIWKSRASTSEVKSSSQAEPSIKKYRRKNKNSSQSPGDAIVEAARSSTQVSTTADSKGKAIANSDEDILDLLVMDTPSPVSQPVLLPELNTKHEEDEDAVQTLTGPPRSFRSIQSARPIQGDIILPHQTTASTADFVDKRIMRDSSLSPKEDVEMVDLTSSPPDSSRSSRSASALVLSSGPNQSIEQDGQDSQNDPNISLDSDLGVQTQVDVQAVMNFHGIPIPNHLFKIGPDLMDEEGEND